MRITNLDCPANRTTSSAPIVGPSAYGPGNAVNELKLIALTKIKLIPQTVRKSDVRLRLSCIKYLVEMNAAITPI